MKSHHRAATDRIKKNRLRFGAKFSTVEWLYEAENCFYQRKLPRVRRSAVAFILHGRSFKRGQDQKVAA